MQVVNIGEMRQEGRPQTRIKVQANDEGSVALPVNAVTGRIKRMRTPKHNIIRKSPEDGTSRAYGKKNDNLCYVHIASEEL